MAILFLLNGMVKVFLSLHDKHSTPLRLRAIMRIKKGAGNMAQDVYNSQYGNVKYIEKDNVALLTWKQKCSYDDYRDTTLAALNTLQKHGNSNLVIDARNGFEDEKEDVEWGFTILLPAMSKTTCKAVVFIMEVVNDIEEEIDMWTAEFMKYFKVHKVDSYKKAIDTIS